MNLGGFFQRWKERRRIARIDEESDRFSLMEKDWRLPDRLREIKSECDLPPRPLTEEEDTLLRWILEHGSAEARSFLPQVEGIRAVRSCICGCPTIRLVVSENLQLGFHPTSRIVCDLEGKTAKGELVGVLLFHDNGKLAELEAYSIDGEIQSETNEYGFPEVESLCEISEFQPPAAPVQERISSTSKRKLYFSGKKRRLR